MLIDGCGCRRSRSARALSPAVEEDDATHHEENFDLKNLYFANEIRNSIMTINLYIVTSDAVYMAADSRQFPSGADTVQKIFLLGADSITGHGGIGVISYEEGTHKDRHRGC